MESIKKQLASASQALLNAALSNLLCMGEAKQYYSPPPPQVEDTDIFWCDDQGLFNMGTTTVGEVCTISSLSLVTQKPKIRQRNHQQKKNVKVLDKREYHIQRLDKKKELADNLDWSIIGLMDGDREFLPSMVSFREDIREKRTYAVTWDDIPKVFIQLGIPP
ncbi:unnamed protein product [Lepeophtheirus salmonis]|uniref:(salmon louse) hypothetical protein n=1 Tax=Lepeophtheirus salmonis TaxID=72036 RepID=A0A817FGA1_LEPSM|nr:unnamed protein product [Lepeophtheirus salmonis]CAG9478819.1 unnamed protein product [Lepeophtheirus salmonis]